jgi:hypothetical protein
MVELDIFIPQTQLTSIYLEDFLHTSLFPEFLPQTVGGFINNILRGYYYNEINYDVPILHRKNIKKQFCSYVEPGFRSRKN